VTDDHAGDLIPDPPTGVGGALEKLGVALGDGRKGCQGLAFVLQACPMREAGPTAETRHEPVPGAVTVLERPPAGMARGVFATSPLVVVLVAVALALVAAGYYAARLRGARRR
jgi:hypothetical protein